MININPLKIFSDVSGIINTSFFEGIYQTFMDAGFAKIARIITLHLKPIIEQDIVTQSQPQASQYNPFLGRVATPITNTKYTGTKITPRDVIYNAHIRIGPLDSNQLMGIGNLKMNEAMVTLPIEALLHVQEALSLSIEGRRYSIKETRPIGFSQRRYILLHLQEIQESDIAARTNEG